GGRRGRPWADALPLTIGALARASVDPRIDAAQTLLVACLAEVRRISRTARIGRDLFFALPRRRLSADADPLGQENLLVALRIDLSADRRGFEAITAARGGAVETLSELDGADLGLERVESRRAGWKRLARYRPVVPRAARASCRGPAIGPRIVAVL